MLAPAICLLADDRCLTETKFTPTTASLANLTDWKYILFYKMKRLLVPYFVACFFV